MPLTPLTSPRHQKTKINLFHVRFHTRLFSFSFWSAMQFCCWFTECPWGFPWGCPVWHPGLSSPAGSRRLASALPIQIDTASTALPIHIDSASTVERSTIDNGSIPECMERHWTDGIPNGQRDYQSTSIETLKNCMHSELAVSRGEL